MKTTDTLRIGENVYEYEWRRKPIKTLNLRVRPDGSLYVSSPPFVSKKEVERFLQERRLFIEKASMRGLTLAEGTSVHIFGKEMPLFIEPAIRRHHACITENGVYLYVYEKDNRDERVNLYRNLLKETAEYVFPQVLARLYPVAAPYGVPYPQMKLRRMRSRWGSCIPTKRLITLNTYLVIAPLSCTDQVVLHEICHFLEPNHSVRFYAYLSRMMPEWRRWREALKEYTPYCL